MYLIKNKKWLLSVLLLLSSIAYGDEVKVGVCVYGPPIIEKVHTDTGTFYSGFSIDLMNSICQHINKKCTYSEVTSDNQFKLLNSGRVDVLVVFKPYALSEMNQYAVSLPYAESKIHFIASRDSSINSIEDIKNKKIGVIQSTFYNLLLASSYSNHNSIIAYEAAPDLSSSES